MSMKKPSHAKPEESFFMLNSHKVFQRMLNARPKTSTLHTKLREFYLNINVQWIVPNVTSKLNWVKNLSWLNPVKLMKQTDLHWRLISYGFLKQSREFRILVYIHFALYKATIIIIKSSTNSLSHYVIPLNWHDDVIFPRTTFKNLSSLSNHDYKVYKSYERGNDPRSWI